MWPTEWVRVSFNAAETIHASCQTAAFAQPISSAFRSNPSRVSR